MLDEETVAILVEKNSKSSRKSGNSSRKSGIICRKCGNSSISNIRESSSGNSNKDNSLSTMQ